MSDKKKLFTKITPSEETSLSGGNRRSRGRSQLKANADATAVVIGDAQRTDVRTNTRTHVTDCLILAHAFSFVRVIL